MRSVVVVVDCMGSAMRFVLRLADLSCGGGVLCESGDCCWTVVRYSGDGCHELCVLMILF